MSMEGIEWLGILAGVMTSVSSIPQLIKINKEKEAKDVSLKMVILLIIGVSLWIVYGSIKNDFALIITNSFSVLLNCYLLFLRIKYGHR